MADEVFCIKHQKNEPAVDAHIPFGAELKEQVQANVCQEAWNEWLVEQVKIINELALNLGVYSRPATAQLPKHTSSVTPSYLPLANTRSSSGFMPSSVAMAMAARHRTAMSRQSQSGAQTPGRKTGCPRRARSQRPQDLVAEPCRFRP